MSGLAWGTLSVCWNRLGLRSLQKGQEDGLQGLCRHGRQHMESRGARVLDHQDCGKKDFLSSGPTSQC